MVRFFQILAASMAMAIFAPELQAAEVTVVSSAFDDDNPFDLKIELGWSNTWHSTKITRENRQHIDSLGREGVVDVTELSYKRSTSQFRPTIRAGLYKDLEFYFTWPYVFRESQSWSPKNPDDPTTLNNPASICADGRVDQECREPLFPFTDDTGMNNSYRSGLDNGTIGFRWGILNEDRHPWSASWVVGVGWTFPMVSERDPTDVSHSPDNANSVADRVNRWHFETALSRQIGLVDPFIRFHYTLPHARSSAYHNCDYPSMLADMDRTEEGVQNTCAGPDQVWTRQGSNHGGLKPAHFGGFELGTEVLPYIDPENFVRIAVQLSVGAAFVSEGRDYTLLSDALHRITYHEEHAHLHATLGLRAQASRYAKFHALFTLGHDTAHLLTRETVGRDRTDSGVVDLTYTDQDIQYEERNPNFDFRWDQPGRRFRAEETRRFTLLLMGELHF